MFGKPVFLISLLTILLAACVAASEIPPTSPVSTVKAAPTLQPPTATEDPCAMFDAQDYDDFVEAMKCALDGLYCPGDREFLSRLFHDPILFQQCSWAGCPYESIKTRPQPAADQLCTNIQPPDLTSPVYLEYTLYDTDVSLFPASPLLAEHTLVASSLDGLWVLYLGFALVDNRYMITDLLVDNNFPPPTPYPTEDPNLPWLTYHDEQAGFSIQYPPNWVEDLSYPGYFTYEVPYPSNLSWKEMHVAWHSSDLECSKPAAGAIEATAPPEQVVIHGIHFTKDQGADQGMNQVHESSSYSTLHGSACISITFTLHWVKPGVYSPEPPSFDHAAEIALFEEILTTLRFDP